MQDADGRAAPEPLTVGGQHTPLPTLATLGLGADASLGALAKAVRQDVGSGWLMLSEPAICFQNCTKCRKMCEVRATEAAWLRKPLCKECGGPWTRSEHPSPSAYQAINLSDPHDGWDSSLWALGLRPGASVIHQTPRQVGLITVAGNTIDTLSCAWADPT